MDPFGLNEDLSLFNGDLLVDFPPAANEEPSAGLLVQDGLTSIIKTSEIEAPFVNPRPSAKVVLGHPQQGSADLGLADLLGATPSKDLRSPLELTWMDTKVDLLDLLTSETNVPSAMTEAPAQVIITQSRPSQLQLSIPSPGRQAAVVPSTSAPTTPDPEDASLEASLDILQNLLSADVKVHELNLSQGHQSQDIGMNPPEQDPSYFPQPETFQNITSEEDILMDLDATGLEDLLESTMDASVKDSHILSPVSTADFESILSSSPPSPGNGLTSFIDTLDATYSPAPHVDSAYSSMNVSLISDAEDAASVKNEQDDIEEFMLPESSPGPERIGKTSLRSEPYSQPGGKRGRVTERKERKKQQNRTAALRYREKKKQEKSTVFDECDELETRNTELKDKVDSISREINYLKDLLAEVYKAKGLVPKKPISKILRKK